MVADQSPVDTGMTPEAMLATAKGEVTKQVEVVFAGLGAQSSRFSDEDIGRAVMAALSVGKDEWGPCLAKLPHW